MGMHEQGYLSRTATTENADSGRTLKLLREKEKQFRDLYDNAPVAYFSVSATDGSIIGCNLAAQRLLGLSKKTLTRKKVLDLYADTEHGLCKAKQVFKRFKAGETIQDVELQIKNRAGKPVWVSLSVEPVPDQNGQVQGQILSGGMGFSSQNQRRLHFGLGKSSKVDKIEILWPSGIRQDVFDPVLGKVNEIKELP